MELGDVLKNISERQDREAALTDVARNLVFDVGLMTAWDTEPVVLPKAGPKREQHFQQLARDNAQVMLNQMYQNALMENGELYLTLAEPTTLLPRAKPVPAPKQPTKWERFAQEKGIKSTKGREKLVWDDSTRKWVPRYGYNRAKNQDEKDWIIELPDNADPNVDYFKKRDEDKKERVAKNKYQQLRNVERAQKTKTN